MHCYQQFIELTQTVMAVRRNGAFPGVFHRFFTPLVRETEKSK